MDEIIEKFTKESNCAGACAHSDSVFDSKKSLEYYLKKELKEQLLLYSVTQQRELLIAFSEWWINVEKPITCNHKNIVDKYLSNL